MNELNVIYSLISILFLIALLFWLSQDYWVDSFRQQMFSLRDELFDDARNGRISFDDSSYGMLRSSMNGFIQFGHRLNIWQVILLNIIASKEGGVGTKSFYKRLEEGMQNNTAEQKELITNYYLRMNFCVIKHIINSSIILTVTLIVPVIFFLVKMQLKTLAKFYNGYMDKIDSAALATGEIK